MNFDCAQIFFVDKALVQNSAEISISMVELYFKNVPKITGNKSGIYGPGVEVFLAPCINGIPAVELAPFIAGRYAPIQYARREYESVVRSADALAPTKFTFPRPVALKTGQEYAIIIKFDGNEEFELWTNVKSDVLIDSNQTSPGNTNRNVGSYFTYIGPTNYQDNFVDTSIPSDSTAIQNMSAQQFSALVDFDYIKAAWKPVTSTTLKFNVFCARYSFNGTAVTTTGAVDANTTHIYFGNNGIVVSNNLIRLTAPHVPLEFVYFDKKYSASDNTFYGEKIYQSQPYFPGTASPLTVNVVANAIYATCPNNYVLPNTAVFNWSMLYSGSRTESEYIVVTSLNHDGAGKHRVNVRQVVRQTNGALIVAEPWSFTNAAAYCYKSPVARLQTKSRPYVSGYTRDLIVLAGSNANASCRFVNGTINSISITTGGSGYSNADYIRITGYESVTNEVLGGYVATANLTTNSTGGITNVYITNAGAGFTNTSAITIAVANSSGGTANGTAATFTATTGATLYTETGGMNVYFANCVVTNFDAQNIWPLLNLNNPQGTVYGIKYQCLYSSANSANTLSGRRYYLNDSPQPFDIQNFKQYIFNSDTRPCVVSRSNQFVTGYANGYVPNTSVIGAGLSNGSVLLIDIYSNNDFCSVSFEPSDLYTNYGRYNINNDYTNEHTNYGNAYAKGVSTKVNLSNGAAAEDLLVYLTAYRPANTDFKVYCRFYNSIEDTGDSFDDKDWTLLEQVDGIGVYTNPQNLDDRVELTYGLPLYPNTSFTLGGVVTTTISSATITGTGTTFTSNLAVGDLIRVYQPLFSNTNYTIAVVNSITNNISLTIKSPITNASLVATGMKIDKIAYPKQAFKNFSQANVIRYYDSSLVEHDTYDTFQLKIVFLSPSEYVVPKLDDVKAVAVTS